MNGLSGTTTVQPEQWVSVDLWLWASEQHQLSAYARESDNGLTPEPAHPARARRRPRRAPVPTTLISPRDRACDPLTNAPHDPWADPS